MPRKNRHSCGSLRVKIGSVKDNANPHGTAADLTPDAHLAALSIEHGARLYSTDNDFSRFQSLRWTNPIEKI